MDLPWSRIVCYGLGHFDCLPDAIEDYCKKYRRKSKFKIDEEQVERRVRSHTRDGSAQLDFLLELKETHKVPVFIYDPVFTEKERYVLQELGLRVLDCNLPEFKHHTLYYLPYCMRYVTDVIIAKHAVGDQIGIIGNSKEFTCRGCSRFLQHIPVKKAKTRKEHILYREHYLLEFV